MDGSMLAIVHPNGKLLFSTTIKATVSSVPKRAMSSKSGKTGFICPLCHETLRVGKSERDPQGVGVCVCVCVV